MNKYSLFSFMSLIKLILFIFHLKSDTCDYSHILSQNAVFMSWGQAHLLRPFSDKNVQYFQNSKKSQNFENFPKLKRKFPIYNFFLNYENFDNFIYIFSDIENFENLKQYWIFKKKIEHFGKFRKI